MKTMKAIKNHSYAQKVRRAGKVYQARDMDVPLLVRLNLAEIEHPARTVKRRLADSEPTPKKRHYKRRDMTAEERGDPCETPDC